MEKNLESKYVIDRLSLEMRVLSDEIKKNLSKKPDDLLKSIEKFQGTLVSVREELYKVQVLVQIIANDIEKDLYELSFSVDNKRVSQAIEEASKLNIQAEKHYFDLQKLSQEFEALKKWTVLII